jgi:hypothetical protein
MFLGLSEYNMAGYAEPAPARATTRLGGAGVLYCGQPGCASGIAAGARLRGNCWRPRGGRKAR